MIFHALTSGHEFFSKPGVGQFALCYWRVVGSIREIWFRIPNENAQWTPVPDMATAYKIMECTTYLEAMAVLRGATKS